jgi:DNA-binding transcriptional ArsR family regulator
MESVNLDDLARGLLGFGHPLRVRALVLLEFESSPGALAEALDAPLGVVSYHVRMLRGYGLAELTRTEPQRGALQHFYRRTEFADVLFARVAPLLDLPKRPAGRGQDRFTKRHADLVAWAQEEAPVEEPPAKKSRARAAA